MADFINTYSYDAAGRMTQVTQAGQPGGRTVAEKRVDLAYDNLGRIDTIARFEDLAGSEHVATSDYTFDLVGRLISLAHTAGAVSLASYSYTYDKLNRLTQATSVDGTKNYSYDAIGQLTGVTGAASESYSYDATGNRTGGTVIGTNNRLLDDGTYTYQYDDAGNRTKKSTIATGDYVTYEWDHRNRLVSVAFYTSADVLTKRVEYDYDAFDRRIAKRVDDDGDGSFDRGERFVYDGADVVLVFDESGSLKSRYLHGPGVDQIFADEDALGEILWALTDRQGSVRDVADYDAASDSTTVVNHIQYDSFGNIISESNPAVEFLYAFTGRVWDADAELYYYRARWYDPVTGRFVSEDPIGFVAGDVNLVRYVGNGVTNFVDPSGLEWFWNWEWSQAGDNYIANLTGPNSFGAGLVDGAAGVAKSLNPVNVWNRAKGIPAGLRNDWRKIQSMCNAPKEYFWRRYDVISGGISNQFSTPAGWGEAYVYGAGAVVGAKIPTGRALIDRVRCVPNAPRTINRIGDLSNGEADALRNIWKGGPRSRLPLWTRERLADLYSDVARKNPSGSAQSAFNQGRADYLLGRGPNPGTSVNDFSTRTGLPKFRR